MAREARSLAAAVFQPRHDYLPGTEVFRPIDVETVTSKLDLEARGKADGAAGIPALESGSLTVAETDIVGRLDAAWVETVMDAKRAHTALCDRFAAYTAETEIDILLAEPRATALRLKQIAADEADALDAAYENVKLARTALARFVEREGLDNEPAHGQSTQQKLFWLSLAALAEFVVNIGIFGMADAQGFAGAAPKVVLIPILNIGVAFALAFGMARRVLMRSLVQKLVGIGGWLLAVGWVLGLNLVVAHWRDAQGSALDVDAGVAALASVASQPLQLTSVNSWALLAIGVAAGAVAIYEGWWWDDPYPGYGRRRKAVDKATAGFRRSRESAIARLQEEADASANHLGGEQAKAARAFADRPDIAAKVVSLGEDLALYAAHLERTARNLFARYREANVRARTTPVPASFETPPPTTFVVPTLRRLEVDADAIRISGRLATALHEVTTAHEEACNLLPSLREYDERGT